MLIRSDQWAAAPVADDGFPPPWKLEDGNLPPNTFGFWVSGGHTDPVYYACANRNNPALHIRNAGGWSPAVTTFAGGANLLPGGQHGPVFVNPYNPDHLLALTDQGVQYSTDRALSFTPDDDLTNLVTKAGAVRTSDVFTGGNFDGVVQANGYFSIDSGCLAHVAFLRSDPREVVAISPFGGVFYNRGDISGHSWQDLTYLLPQPLPRCTTVAITDQAAYLSTFGRGVMRIVNYRSELIPMSSIRLVNVDDCGVGPPQGGTAIFRADTHGLIAPLRYTWTVVGGAPAANQPQEPNLFAVDLPANNAHVTVTVKISGADGQLEIATTTYVAPTRWWALLLDLMCLERQAPLYPWQYNPLAAGVPDPVILPVVLRDVAETQAAATATAALCGQILDEIYQIK